MCGGEKWHLFKNLDPVPTQGTSNCDLRIMRSKQPQPPKANPLFTISTALTMAQVTVVFHLDLQLMLLPASLPPLLRALPVWSLSIIYQIMSLLCLEPSNGFLLFTCRISLNPLPWPTVSSTIYLLSTSPPAGGSSHTGSLCLWAHQTHSSWEPLLSSSVCLEHWSPGHKLFLGPSLTKIACPIILLPNHLVLFLGSITIKIILLAHFLFSLSYPYHLD